MSTENQRTDVGRESSPLRAWLFQFSPAIISVALAFYLGSAHVASVPHISFSSADKVGHFLLFGLVQFTHVRAARFIYPNRSVVALCWAAALSATIFGGLLEVWQAALPHRSAEFADFVADGLGAAVMALVYSLVHRARSDSGVQEPESS